MKLPTHNPNENMEVQKGPKLRNINSMEEEIPKEKPEGADIRLKLLTAAIAVLIVIFFINSTITKSSLTSQYEEQKKLFDEAESKALLLGITRDDDGDLIIPEIDVTSNVSKPGLDSIEQRNSELIDAFTNLMLNWKGKDGYDKVRQTLIDDWKFKEDSKLLSSYMPPIDEEINANMSRSTYNTFVLSNDGKSMSYFIICTVRNTIDGASATGTVGIHMTINEDGTISNVTAQTLS